jgi:ribosome-binding protein aMBF1 (putative translation factor)
MTECDICGKRTKGTMHKSGNVRGVYKNICFTCRLEGKVPPSISRRNYDYQIKMLKQALGEL